MQLPKTLSYISTALAGKSLYYYKIGLYILKVRISQITWRISTSLAGGTFTSDIQRLIILAVGINTDG